PPDAHRDEGGGQGCSAHDGYAGYGVRQPPKLLYIDPRKLPVPDRRRDFEVSTVVSGLNTPPLANTNLLRRTRKREKPRRKREPCPALASGMVAEFRQVIHVGGKRLGEPCFDQSAELKSRE